MMLGHEIHRGLSRISVRFQRLSFGVGGFNFGCFWNCSESVILIFLWRFFVPSIEDIFRLGLISARCVLRSSDRFLKLGFLFPFFQIFGDFFGFCGGFVWSPGYRISVISLRSVKLFQIFEVTNQAEGDLIFFGSFFSELFCRSTSQQSRSEKGSEFTNFLRNCNGGRSEPERLSVFIEVWRALHCGGSIVPSLLNNWSGGKKKKHQKKKASYFCTLWFVSSLFVCSFFLVLV